MRALVESGCWINGLLASSGRMEEWDVPLRGRFDSASLVARSLTSVSLRIGGWREIAMSLIF